MAHSVVRIQWDASKGGDMFVPVKEGNWANQKGISQK